MVRTCRLVLMKSERRRFGEDKHFLKIISGELITRQWRLACVTASGNLFVWVFRQ